MNILVIDDNRLMRDMVGAMVSSCGHDVCRANGYREAFEVLHRECIDLILMDVEMPEMNGFTLTRKIRKEFTRWIPIIFISSNDTEDHLAQGIDAGGDDYLTKPVKQVILKAKIKAMERIAQMKKQLDEANDQLERLTCIDPLTQVANRRHMDSLLEEAWNRNVREDADLSIMLIDIDHFKLFNDHYGHQKGDDCLVQFANVLKKVISRTTDTIARYGGEEFLIILPYTPLEVARFKAQEIMRQLAAEAIEHQQSPTRPYITASFGLSSTSLNPSTVSMLIEQADKALYSAKDKGRNQLAIYVSS